ncbi:hypothetical protein [Agromyces sp. NPDC058064]|uniref:hypothetical protein n=1 Tax=Agromyces sp. NPDC058064 TaxID=3346322 RepID=UPI0036D8532C
MSDPILPGEAAEGEYTDSELPLDAELPKQADDERATDDEVERDVDEADDEVEVEIVSPDAIVPPGRQLPL